MKRENIKNHAITQYRRKTESRRSKHNYGVKIKRFWLRGHCGKRMFKVYVYRNKTVMNGCTCSDCTSKWERATSAPWAYCSNPNCTYWENLFEYDGH